MTQTDVMAIISSAENTNYKLRNSILPLLLAYLYLSTNGRIVGEMSQQYIWGIV